MKTFRTSQTINGNEHQVRNELAANHSNHIVRAYASDPAVRGVFEGAALVLTDRATLNSIKVVFKTK
jgi:hypothetical protein